MAKVLTKIDSDQFRSLLHGAEAVAEPMLPFPKVNDLEFVLNVASFLIDQEKDRKTLAQEFGVEPKVMLEYMQACMYFGLVKSNGEFNANYSLSLEGQSILKEEGEALSIGFLNQIFKHDILRTCLLKSDLTQKRVPDLASILEELKEREFKGDVGEEHLINCDFKAKAARIQSWCTWVLNLIDNSQQAITPNVSRVS